MRRFLGFFAFMIVLGVASFFIVKNYLPPNKDVKNLLPQGPGTLSAFSLPHGYSLDVYADLGRGQPRVLAFDDYGNLLATVPNKKSVVAFLDVDKNGKSDKQVDVLTDLNNPHGIVVYGGYLFVAQTNKISRFAYNPSTNTATNEEVLFTLLGGGKNPTRTIKIYNDKLYTSVGSSCDTCIERDEQRASILASNLDGTDLKVFATGLRNTAFFTFDERGRIWGNDLGIDSFELNIISEGGNYGWPHCFGQRTTDVEFQNEDVYYCNQTTPSVFDYPAPSAPLGIVRMGDSFLVALGYKIVKVNTFAGEVVGMEDYLFGFIKGGEILGRPVDLVFDSEKKLFISDDHTGLIYVLYK